MERCDFLIVGAGIAGATAGYHLSPHGTVVLIERESQPGYHTTGRSAAFFVESYGNRFIRPLTRASRSFFVEPPEGFTSAPLLGDRGAIYIARADQLESLSNLERNITGTVPGARRLTPEEVRDRAPCLRADYVAAGLFENDARDIDVHALHHGFLGAMRRQGGRVVTDAGLLKLDRVGGWWRARTSCGDFEARTVINAAGAWGDVVAGLARARPLGLAPMRRTIIVFPAPPDCDSAAWPLIIDAGERFYFKPDSGRILASPADETLMAPCDAQPDELDVALTIDRIQKATTLDVPRLDNKWAGLRTFAPDRTPVVGWDPEVPGFFWFVGQGGYGMQTAPAMGQMMAGLIVDGRLPDDLAALGAAPEHYALARFY
ncbi:MAG: NAD(P)/FAD-dependent oxidoreductase [Sphingomonadales bacterium]